MGLLACMTAAPAQGDGNGDDAAADGSAGSAIARDMGEWLEVFDAVRDYVFVALCDADCCDLALEVLRRMVFESSLGADVFSEGTLLGSLRLLFPVDADGNPAEDADEACQAQVRDF